MGRLSLLVKIFFVVVLPVLLLRFGVVPIKGRVYVFGAVFVVTLIAIFLERISPKKLGIRLDNIKGAAINFGIVVIPGAILVVILSYLFPHNKLGFFSPVATNVLSPVQYLLISIPIQQIVYFGYLNAQLRGAFKNKFIVALLNGILFSMLHVPWGNDCFTAFTLGAGITVSALYTYSPNLFVSSLAHMLVGGLLLHFVFS